MKKIFVYLATFMLFFSFAPNNKLKANDDDGLQWSEFTSEVVYDNPEKAIYYCENLNEGGYSDWRLPNIDELITKLKMLKFCSKGISNQCKVSEINQCFSAQNCAGISSINSIEAMKSNKCLCIEDLELFSGKNAEEIRSIISSIPLYMYKLEIILEKLQEKMQKGTFSAEEMSTLNKFGITREILQKIKTNTLSYEEKNKLDYINLFSSFLLSSSHVSENSDIVWGINGAGILYGHTGIVKCVRGKNLCENNQSCEKMKNSTGKCIKASINDFSCECAFGYFWNSKECVTPCDKNTCNAVLPHSTGTCTALSATEYSCGCEKGFLWDGKECVTPCDKNTCNAVLPHSTGTCTALSVTDYSCGCEKGFLWDGTRCVSALLGNICTGQNKCYDNEKEIPCPVSANDDFYGQDSQYSRKKKCKSQSFALKTVSGQKIIIDNNIGLIWQETIPTEEMTWDDAKNYCSNLTYAGYSDWRLPTPQELMTIIDNSRVKPAIDTTYFPNTPSHYFWSSTKKYSGSVGGVNFDEGRFFGKQPFNTGYVRCVR